MSFSLGCAAATMLTLLMVAMLCFMQAVVVAAHGSAAAGSTGILRGFTLWQHGHVLASLRRNDDADTALRVNKAPSICGNSRNSNNAHASDLAIQALTDDNVHVGNVTLELYGPNDYFHSIVEPTLPYSVFGKESFRLSTATLAPGIYTVFAMASSVSSLSRYFSIGSTNNTTGTFTISRNC